MPFGRADQAGNIGGNSDSSKNYPFKVDFSLKRQIEYIGKCKEEGKSFTEAIDEANQLAEEPPPPPPKLEPKGPPPRKIKMPKRKTAVPEQSEKKETVDEKKAA